MLIMRPAELIIYEHALQCVSVCVFARIPQICRLPLNKNVGNDKSQRTSILPRTDICTHIYIHTSKHVCAGGTGNTNKLILKSMLCEIPRLQWTWPTKTQMSMQQQYGNTLGVNPFPANVSMLGAWCNKCCENGWKVKHDFRNLTSLVRKCRCLTDLLINVHSGCYLHIYADLSQKNNNNNTVVEVLLFAVYTWVYLMLLVLKLTGLHVQPLNYAILQLIFCCVCAISVCWVFQPFSFVF